MIKPTVSQLKRMIGNPNAIAWQDDKGNWFPQEGEGFALDPETLAQHTHKIDTYGTYVVWGDKARTLVFDLDEGTDEECLAKAVTLAAELHRFGIPKRSVGIEFSGRKGYHVWMLMADFVPAKELRRLGRAVLGTTGIQCEVFPKQDEAKQLGSLIKLPGGVHQVTGNENNFVDKVPAPMSKQVLRRVLETLPPEPEKPKGGDWDGADLVPCIGEIADGVGNGSRNNALYHYAVLLRGSHRVPEEGVRVLVQMAAAACDPPYGDGPGEAEELEQLIISSRDGGPLCDQLPETLRCSPDQCVKNRMKGKLTCRTGQLKHAKVGDGVVMQVKARHGTQVLDLDHPDRLAGGKVSVR
jgi:hypothetical protein